MGAAHNHGQSLGRRVIQEGKEICTASISQAGRLVGYAKAAWHHRGLKRLATETEEKLGDEAWKSGVGDGGLRQQIAALDEQLQSAKPANRQTKTLHGQRRLLLRQLGDTLLTNDAPPPPVAGVWARANDARKAVGKHKTALGEMESGPDPGHQGWLAQGGDWLRDGFGNRGILGARPEAGCEKPSLR